VSLRVVIGIEYDEQAYNDQSRSSLETYEGVYVFTGPDFSQGKKVFNTGDPVEDLKSAREFARERTTDIFLSSTFDFFPAHSCGTFRHAIDPDGYRTIEWTCRNGVAANS
jgi:hypothetical protein